MGFRSIGDVLVNNKLIERLILVEAAWKINYLEYKNLHLNIVNLHRGIERCSPKIGPSITVVT